MTGPARAAAAPAPAARSAAASAATSAPASATASTTAVAPADAAAALDASLVGATVLDKAGYAYLVHPLTDGVPRADPALLHAWTDWVADQDLAGAATLLLAPEAMALPLAAAVSLRTGLPYVVARKRPYGLPGEAVAAAKTGYGEARLHLNDVRPEDRVLVLDDVLSTGATVAALLDALAQRGVRVEGVLVFLDKGRSADGIAARYGVPVRAMRRVAVDGGRVRLLP